MINEDAALFSAASAVQSLLFFLLFPFAGEPQRTAAANGRGQHQAAPQQGLRVVARARRLVPQRVRDRYLAAVLHDVARPEEKACRKVCHAARGAEIAAEILEDLHVEKTFADRIVAAVRTHRYRDDNAPQTLEEKIVYDADKLDSLGAAGIGRAFLFAGKFGARLHNTEQEALNSEAYSKEDTAYREYLVKLRYLPDAMLTAPGKRIASERISFMREFFDRLNQEVQCDRS